MVLENIFRHNEDGLPRMEAAIIGAREISFAALAATLAIAAIFLPVAFMKGIIGKFFFQFGVTITTAVLLSLLEALTITPMRCSRFVSMNERTDFVGRHFDRLMDWSKHHYAVYLEKCLRYPWLTVLAATLIMLASLGSIAFIKKEFTPAQDQSRFMLRVKTDIDSSITHTDQVMKQVEEFLHSRSEIKQYYVAVGGFSGKSFNSGMVFVTMKPKKERPINADKKRPLTQQEFMAVVRSELAKKIKGVKIFAQDLSTGGLAATSRGYPIEFTVRGPDWDELWKQTQEIMEKLKASGLAADIDTDYLLGKPEVQILPNREQAALRGVSIQDIGTTIGTMIGGQRVNQYSENGHRYYTMVQVPPEKQDLKTLKGLLVANSQGNLVPIAKVVQQETKSSLQAITRIDRQRAISVYGSPAPGHSQQEVLNLIESLSRQLPPGYRTVLSGSAKSFQESFDSLIFALITGVFVAYMVLASQFNSFIDPISILVALPFSVSGAFLALLLFQQSLNIYSMIGLILLMGIVKKNSILLVEFTNTVRDRGEHNVRKALLTACPIRLRPILMTSFACITAAVPGALALGPGSETTIPMAISIIGGVTVSTLLTLFVVPCSYELFSRIQKRDDEITRVKEAFQRVGSAGMDPSSTAQL